jgi:hypothetical protein
MTKNTDMTTTGGDISPETLDLLISTGDIGKLNPTQRIAYYRARCERAGLDPTAQPFEYLTLQGKTILYAKKGATDQLASVHKIRTSILSQSTEGGVRVVTVRAEAADGRATEEVGVANVEGLKGDNLGNAMMKAVTKAKRRAILSLCGLGMMDETEVETVKADPVTGEVKRALPATPPAKPQAARTVDTTASAPPKPASRPAPSQEPRKEAPQDDGINPLAPPEQGPDGWVFQGVPISDKIAKGFESYWGKYAAVKDDSKMKDLVGYTWAQLAEGSPGGKRERALRYVVARARDEWIGQGRMPIEWSQKAAWTLNVMFARHTQADPEDPIFGGRDSDPPLDSATLFNGKDDETPF